MKQRNIIAKKNLKKSLYLGGGMAFFVAVIGLSVSIPVYNTRKGELAKKVSKLSDLSSFMTQLTNKLGVPEDQEFRTSLSGGYEVVYSHGETKIFKNTSSGQSLVMNMNADGSVGSAAQLEGPAAQAMLGVISNAQETMADDAAAMNDILSPFIDNAEDTSLNIESTVTGIDRNALVARNALAGIDQNDKDAVDRALRAGAKHAAEMKVHLENPKLSPKQMSEQIAKEIENEQNALNKAKEEALELAKIQAEEAQRQKDLEEAQRRASQSSNKVVAEKELFDLQVKNAEKWLNEHKPPISTSNINGQAIIDLKEKTIKDDLAAKQAYIDKAKEDAEKSAAKARALAVAQAGSHQMEYISNGGSVLTKIAQSIPSSAKALMNAMFGYRKSGKTEISPKNDRVKRILENEIIKQGMSSETLNEFENLLTSIHNQLGNDWVNKTVDFNVLVNTYGYKDISLSKLFVLSVQIYNGDKINEILYTGQTTNLSPHDFVNHKLVKVNMQNKSLNQTIKDLSSVISDNIDIQLSKLAATALKSYITGSNFNVINNQNEFKELQKLALYASQSKDVHQTLIDRLIKNLGKRILIDGESIKLNANLISNMFNDILEADGTTEEKYLTQSGQSKGVLDFIGQISKMVVNSLDKEHITNYEEFAQGILNLVNKINLPINKPILSNYDRTKEIIKRIIEILNKNPSKVDIFKKVIKHVNQVENIKNYELFYDGNQELLYNILLSDQEDITEIANENIKLLKVVVSTGQQKINLLDPIIMNQVNSSLHVMSRIASHNISLAESKEIQDKITQIIASKKLNDEEFEILSKYTQNVFDVFSSKDEAIEQLVKVLDPKIIESRIVDIKVFNDWIVSIKSENPGAQITKQMIEKYVWTKEIEISHYDTPTQGDMKMPNWKGSPDENSIVSAQFNPDDGKTYYVNHGGSSHRFVATLEHMLNGNTMVRKIDDKFQNGQTDIPNYISAQTIHDGKLYWVPLNDGESLAKNLWIYDIKTKIINKIPLVHTGGTPEKKLIGEIRALTWTNGKLYGAVSVSASGMENEFIEIEPDISSTKGSSKAIYSYLGRDEGFSDVTSHGSYTWSSGSFSVLGDNFIVAPTQNNGKAIFTIMNVQTGEATSVDISNKLGRVGAKATAIINGKYDPIDKKQTLFYINEDGEVVKIKVKIDAGIPSIDSEDILSLIYEEGGNAPHKGTRGATYVNGAITLYAKNEVVYIKDQTENLENIFRFLIEH